MKSVCLALQAFFIDLVWPQGLAFPPVGVERR